VLHAGRGPAPRRRRRVSGNVQYYQ